MIRTSNSAEDGRACYVCGFDIGDRWFGRVKKDQDRVCLCSPGCVILFCETPPPPLDVADRQKYYHDQYVIIRADKAIQGELYSYDAYLGRPVV